jgi:sirohydrochlorin ferrochelatase
VGQALSASETIAIAMLLGVEEINQLAEDLEGCALASKQRVGLEERTTPSWRSLTLETRSLACLCQFFIS